MEDVTTLGPVHATVREAEVRQSVQRLLARELLEPSEDFVRFLCTRLDERGEASVGGERLAAICRGALRELGRGRPAPAGGARVLAGSAPPTAALPGYYLG